MLSFLFSANKANKLIQLYHLQRDMEIPVIMCGLLAVTTLLPMIPSQLGPYLTDVFSIFARFTSWSVEKPGEWSSDFVSQFVSELVSE